MKLLMVIAYIAFFVIGPPALYAADIQVTVYADNNYPPYSYEEKGEVKGIYTKILAEAFSRIPGYKVTIKAYPWKRGLKMLEDGKGFAIYPPYFRAKQRPYIWPYSIPVLNEKVVVFCRKGVLTKSRRLHWPEDYFGLRIGRNAGYELGGKRFWNAVKNGKITVEDAAGNRENLLKLGLKHIDCYMNDRLSILWTWNQLKASGKYDEHKGYAALLEGATITTEQGFLGFTNRDQGKFDYKDDFVKKFDTIIYEMRRSGEIQRMVQRFLAGR